MILQRATDRLSDDSSDPGDESTGPGEDWTWRELRASAAARETTDRTPRC